MKKISGFGETVEGYNIPVLNEREIRASAGIFFLMILLSLTRIMYTADFLLIKYTITLFLTDFLIRIFINPAYSPSLIIGRFIVGRQTPEYVGAAQKKFAWIIGLVLASAMFVLMVVLNTYSFISGISCMICLVFLFFESAFGICLGCSVYNWFNKEKAQYCPGETCDIKEKHEIQRISPGQIAILAGFIAYVFLTIFFFNGSLSEKPNDLWTMLGSI